ncbi:2-hydroxyacid dehydrogenase [Auriculariales sp. MPI-PUGE-AT-0066]|nr:2-hydroxyacid dehydrogenase [Auriculariales sp. MPI-PUGE-AT-0066]
MPHPKVLICGEIIWANDEVKSMIGPHADIVIMDSQSRDDFLKRLSTDYAGIVGIYRHNSSADFIGIFDAALIKALPDSVKWIAHNGAGYDQIDVHAAKAKGIRVSNTPGAVDDATATTALYLLLSCVRQYSVAERNVRSGKWKAGLVPARDPSLLTLGIFGMGGIGFRLAELARGFPMRVLYHSRNPKPNLPAWCEYYPKERLNEFLAETDVLSVHAPLKKETEGLVGENEFRGLKKGSFVVNTARGKVIDEAALIRAIKDGHLGGAGLDVFPDEPNVNPELFDLPTVTLLPHMGTETKDSQKKMEVRALQNLVDYFTSGAGNDLVPEHKA